MSQVTICSEYAVEIFSYNLSYLHPCSQGCSVSMEAIGEGSGHSFILGTGETFNKKMFPLVSVHLNSPSPGQSSQISI